MAKLGAYYGLCPLIDHRSLLGISRDEENGVVIVTLGKNIAIKFKLSDQKQLHSWRTKHKFGSPIIYDKEQSQYVAAFNENFLRMWNGNEEFLDKLKKLNFNQQIHTIFSCNEKSFIVFKNGAVTPLKAAVENGRELLPENVIDLESEYIVDVLYCVFNENIYIGLVVKSGENGFLYSTMFNSQNQQEKFSKISLKRDTADLRGYVFHLDETSVKFLSLWSDGRIYATELKEDTSNFGELFTAIESISCKEYVSMISLDKNYIAMYGCNSNEEGALLAIFNVQFKVVQTRQSFKLFTNGAKLWCIDGNLFFPVGQNLAVVPFYLDMEQLAALVGSHKVIDNNLEPDVSIVHTVQFASWEEQINFLKENKVPEILDSKIQDLLTQGLSTNMTFEAVLSELSENKNVEMLTQSLLYFTEIPEDSLAKVLKLTLTLEPELFKKDSQKQFNNFPEKLLPFERSELLDLILTKTFNENLLLSNLRRVLSLDEVLPLLEYIYFLLSEDGHSLPSHTNMETEAKLIGWSCILLDANYQKFLLTRDDKVNEILLSLKSLIKESLDSTENLKDVASLLCELKVGRPLHKTIHLGASDYSVEEFPLY